MFFRNYKLKDTVNFLESECEQSNATWKLKGRQLKKLTVCETFSLH